MNINIGFSVPDFNLKTRLGTKRRVTSIWKLCYTHFSRWNLPRVWIRSPLILSLIFGFHFSILFCFWVHVFFLRICYLKTPVTSRSRIANIAPRLAFIVFALSPRFHPKALSSSSSSSFTGNTAGEFVGPSDGDERSSQMTKIGGQRGGYRWNTV